MDGLRARIGFVTQDAQLFSGSIRENLLFVNPSASDADCLAVLQQASCHTLLARAGEIKQPKRREALIENAEKARISRKLVLLDDHVKLDVPLAELAVHEPDARKLVAFLKANRAVRAMLVEKTDRLYRNLKDWVTVDELDVEIHFPKEGVVLSRESRSSEKFMHGIKVLMAKNYIDNLSEEARKGMQEKAEQGIWPTKCPLGYRNVTGPDGKKIIAVDPEVAPIIAKLFEWYATGQYAMQDVSRMAREAGLVYRKSGAKVGATVTYDHDKQKSFERVVKE